MTDEDVRTVSVTTSPVSDNVRTTSESPPSVSEVAGYETYSKRLEVRVRPSELAQWKAHAAAHGLCMTELVHAALAFAVADMPAVLADKERRRRLEEEQRAASWADALASLREHKGTPPI